LQRGIIDALDNGRGSAGIQAMTDAAIIAQRIGARRAGDGYVCDCPACNYHNGFTFRDGDQGALLAACHARRCSFESIINALRARGVLDEPERKRGPTGPHWQSLWNRCGPISVGRGWHLPVDYFRGRGIDIDAMPQPNCIREVVRFCKDALNKETGNKMPAAVFRVDREGVGMVAVHRVFLTNDGRKAALEKPKMALGPVGGAAIRFAPVRADGALAVAEGPESALSFMQLKQLPTWSGVAAGGIAHLILPAEARAVIIALDNDPPGIEAAQDAARRWVAEGRRVWFARPPVGDWNDSLLDAQRKERGTS